MELQTRKLQAKQLYDSWRTQGLYCAKLQSRIKVTLLGWNHLVGTGGEKRRGTADVVRRLSLLHSVPRLLMITDLTVTEELRGSRKYVVIQGSVGGQILRVILLRRMRNELIFYSVMSRNERK